MSLINQPQGKATSKQIMVARENLSLVSHFMSAVIGRNTLHINVSQLHDFFQTSWKISSILDTNYDFTMRWPSHCKVSSVVVFYRGYNSLNKFEKDE